MMPVIVLIGVVVVVIFGFGVYYLFKQIQFFLTATNLYKAMIQKQETIIQLLVDIRDNKKSVSVENIRYGEHFEEDKLDDEFGEMKETILSEYTLTTWDSRKNEIVDALESNDPTEKEWALNELKNFSLKVGEAKEILNRSEK